MKKNATPSNGGKLEHHFHTVKETACHLHLCDKQVRRLISRGDIPAYRFGTALRIKKEDIGAYAGKRLRNPNLFTG